MNRFSAAWQLVWIAVNLAHVAGHLLAARAFRVTVNRISLGLGPTLISRRWRGTTLRLALVPIAFVVRLRAPEGEEAPEGDLGKKPLLTRLIVFAAAPAAVLALGYAAAVWSASFPIETTDPSSRVGALMPGGPAERAGFLPGDRVLALAGKPVATFDELKQALATSGTEAVPVEVERGDQRLTFTLDYVQAADGSGRRIIGVFAVKRVEPALPLGARLVAAAGNLGTVYGKIFEQLERLVVGTSQLETVGGPTVIYVGSPVGTDSAQSIFAQASVVLIANFSLQCFWVPFIDGGRLLFVVLEALRRKPIARRYERAFNGLLVAPLVLAFLLVLKNDFARLLR